MPPMPRVAAISDDGQEPRPRIAVPKSVEVAKRSKNGVLHHVLRVVLVPEEIARQRIRVVQVR